MPITVRVTAIAGVGAEDVRLFRNGVLIKAWNGKQINGAVLKTEADLVAGQDHFTAYAFSESGVKSADASMDVTGPADLARPGELWVLVIGINDYANPTLHLNYARQDAALAAAALAEQREHVASFVQQQLTQQKIRGESRPVEFAGVSLLASSGQAHVRTLLDGEATRSGILKALTAMAHEARPEDALIIYYAGHGVAAKDRYYLLPQDFAAGDDPRALIARGSVAMQRAAISDLDLRMALDDEKAAVAAVILDACQSGQHRGDRVA